MIRAAQSSLRRAVWSHRVGSMARTLSAVAAVALVLLGLSFLLGRLPLPLQLRTVSLPPVRQWVLARQRPVAVLPMQELDPLELKEAAPLPGSRPILSLAGGDSAIEPQPMVPGSPFTVTLLFVNDSLQPLQNIRFNMEISGPTGAYSFPLAVQGALRPNGAASVRVTADALAASCREKYLTSPTDIFRSSGVYLLRLTVFGPDVASNP